MDLGVVENAFRVWFIRAYNVSVPCAMLGCKPRGQLKLLTAGSLRVFVTDDHVLAQVDKVLDLG